MRLPALRALRRRRAIGTALGLALAASEPVAAAGDVSLSGTLELEWAVQTRDGNTQKLEAILEPELRAELGAGWDLTAVGRLRGEAFDRLEPGHPKPQEVSSLSRRGQWGDHVDFSLRELYAEGSAGPAWLRVGKQQIVWGEADGLKVLDVVNPQDFREFILDDFEDSRLPLWALSAEVPVGEALLQLVWLPDPSFHELPEPGSPYAFTSPRLRPPAPPGLPVRIEEVERPRRLLADSDAGVRLSTFWKGWDLSLLYLFHYHDEPVLFAEPRLGPAGPEVLVTPEYERTQLVGGSFSNAFGDLTLRGEVGLSTDRHFSTADRRDADAVVESEELAYVLGLDWHGLEETLLSLQLFQSWILREHSGLLRDRLDTNATLLAERHLWNRRLRLRGIWLHNLNDGDGLLRPELRYELRNDVHLWAGVDVFYGSARGLFGQYDARDRVRLGVEWGF